MQAVGQLIEVGEAGRHPDHLAVAVGDRLDLVERRLHDLAQWCVVLRGALVGDRVDLRLRPVDELVDLALPGIPPLGDAGARAHEATEDRLLADDLRVVAGVRCDRHARGQGVEVRRTADPTELTTALQLRGDRHRVSRLPPAVEVDDRIEDRLVGGTVEVGAADGLHDVGDRILGKQHRPDDALFGVVVLRRGAVAAPAATAVLTGVVDRGPACVEGRPGTARELGNAHRRVPLVGLGVVSTRMSRPYEGAPPRTTAPLRLERTGCDVHARAKPDRTPLRRFLDSPLSTGPGDNRVVRVERAVDHVHRLFNMLWTTAARELTSAR
jgi:hypothetical protein